MGLSGPQIFVQVKKEIAPRQVVYGYLKYEVISEGLNPNLGNREMAAGAVLRRG